MQDWISEEREKEVEEDDEDELDAEVKKSTFILLTIFCYF